MLCGRVAVFLGSKLLLLEGGVGGHAAAGVALGQLEHGVVEGVEACQGDELERVAQLAQVRLQG